MGQSIETLIARRYLVSKRKVRFINVIGIISICGITIGVAALLVALSVFNGFSGVVTSVLVGFDPHIRIEKRGGFTQEEHDSIEHVVKATMHVRAESPFITGKAMLVVQTLNRVVFLRGVDERQVAGVSGLAEKMVLGALSLKDSAGDGSIVIGMTLADRLGTVVGDEISIISPYGFQTALSGFAAPQTIRFRVAGIFESNNKDYDASYAYISTGRAQRLFNFEGRYNGMEIRLDDFSRAEEVKEELQQHLPADIMISTWYDLHQNLYSVMKIERWSAYVLLSLIILVATFNMLGSLTMAVIEKRRDIAVLRAMGMTTKSVVRIFMAEGMLIGMIGTIMGVLLGLFVLWLQVRYHLFPLDPTIYIIPAIPVEIHLADFVAIAVSSMGLTILAAYYPARRAASMLPAEALRWE
ncbi:MAG: ABC transporter permease [Ignavibacteriae bacterium]|nr:ABC transporter permease [Ignavibacteria bacterium]MBI3365861.1 ABC transporter permease [Ignavibacteriota bacterium]